MDLIDFKLEYFSVGDLSFKYILGWKWMDYLC